MRRHRASSPRAQARQNGTAPLDPFATVRAYESDTNPTRPLRPSPLTASTIHGLPLDLLDRLRSFPLFQQAPDSFLAAIGRHLRPQLHQPHDYILTEGDHAKAMYWLVRGAVRVTSRDGESTYAELKPGAFFGEIGILMDIPRTATIIANMRSLVVRLNKEDLKKELPRFPDVERAILDEAKERLAILERKKKEMSASQRHSVMVSRSGKRTRDRVDGDVEMGDSGSLRDGEVVSANKKRKSPSPGLAEAAALTVFGRESMPSEGVMVRQLLKELPLFRNLPAESLHWIGLRARPCSFPPFTDIIKQGTQGRDIYFIVRGEVEVVSATPDDNAARNMARRRSIAAGEHHFAQQVKARLRAGQYFGEVVSLSLAPRRTATVRSISSVECLQITGEVLDELWKRCSPDLRQQVETVAKQRLEAVENADIIMSDAAHDTPKIDELAIADFGPRLSRKNSVPTVTFSDTLTTIDSSPRKEPVMEPYDPDPFLNVDLDNVRSRSRRGSLAPPPPDSHSPGSDPQSKTPSPNGSPLPKSPISPISPSGFKHTSTPPEPATGFKRPRIIRRPSAFSKGIFPDPILISIFTHLDIVELMRLRLVSMHWLKLITTSTDILKTLDLTKYNRRVTDRTLIDIICPFANGRPNTVDMSNCFHVTDEGFAALAASCAPRARVWRMKSVWDITTPAVLDMVSKAKDLEEVDLSNCRKVGDNLLMRVVGWKVPEVPASMVAAHQAQWLAQQQAAAAAQNQQRPGSSYGSANGVRKMPIAPPNPLPPGTIIGCPKLKRLTLSYCKHITDRSMAHIAAHAAQRLEQIDLTRCTTITDVGFQHWGMYQFPALRRLCLADCTYLTDQAVVWLCSAAKELRELDLVCHLPLYCSSAVSVGPLLFVPVQLWSLDIC